jgi:ABC-type branched-subunit amino acid transport system substrate-binding protein
VSATGYGGDLLQSKPAIQAGQGVTFTNLWAPVEAKTPATQYFSDAMKKYGNTPSGVPGFFATMGWFGADVLIHGLEKAGCDADSKTFLSTVRKDSSWDAGGLYPGPIPFNSTEYSKVNCAYFLKLTGNDFVPIPQQSPLCGKTLG